MFCFFLYMFRVLSINIDVLWFIRLVLYSKEECVMFVWCFVLVIVMVIVSLSIRRVCVYCFVSFWIDSCVVFLVIVIVYLVFIVFSVVVEEVFIGVSGVV